MSTPGAALGFPSLQSPSLPQSESEEEGGGREVVSDFKVVVAAVILSVVLRRLGLDWGKKSIRVLEEEEEEGAMLMAALRDKLWREKREEERERWGIPRVFMV